MHFALAWAKVRGKACVKPSGDQVVSVWQASQGLPMSSWGAVWQREHDLSAVDPSWQVKQLSMVAGST